MIVKLLRRVLQIHSFVHVSVALEAPGSADAEAPRSSVVEAPGIAVVRALGSVAVEAPCSVVAEAPGSVDVEAPESADSAVASTDEKDDPMRLMLSTKMSVIRNLEEAWPHPGRRRPSTFAAFEE